MVRNSPITFLFLKIKKQDAQAAEKGRRGEDGGRGHRRRRVGAPAAFGRYARSGGGVEEGHFAREGGLGHRPEKAREEAEEVIGLKTDNDVRGPVWGCLLAH